MTVQELIAELKKYPPTMHVCIWDAETDDYEDVVEALYEDGSTHLALLTKPSGAIPVDPGDG